MPELAGTALAGEIALLPPDLPIVLMRPAIPNSAPPLLVRYRDRVDDLRHARSRLGERPGDASLHAGGDEAVQIHDVIDCLYPDFARRAQLWMLIEQRLHIRRHLRVARTPLESAFVIGRAPGKCTGQ